VCVRGAGFHALRDNILSQLAGRSISLKICMKVSVIIGTYNRRDLLARTLPTVLSQDFPAQEYEVVVVVDGSTDGTAEYLRGLRPPCELRVITQPNCGLAAARNAGAEAARGELLVFLDDDILCDRRLLAAHVAAHEGPGRFLVRGSLDVIPESTPTLTADWMQAITKRIEARFRRDEQTGWPAQMILAANSSVSRATYLAAGGNDGSVGLIFDFEFGLKVFQMGVRFRYQPAAMGVHVYRKRAHEIVCSEIPSYGRGEAILLRRYPAYRPNSWLAKLGEAGFAKRWGYRLCARLPISPDPLLAVPFWIAERFRWIPWIRHAGGELLRFRCGVGKLRAAAQEVGTWENLAGQYAARLPVLLYHHIGPSRPGGYPTLTVSPHRFELHIRWLARRGYTGIRASDWLHWCREGKALPPKPVLLTFDDAYADVAEYALPILRRHGFSAVVFVPTGEIGGINRWDVDRGSGTHQLMTAEQIRYWSSQGMEFGAHSRTHADLTGLTGNELEREIKGGKLELEKVLQKPVVSFAYPYGSHSPAVRKLVRENFEMAFAAEPAPGRNNLRSDRYLLQRTMVQSNDSWLDLAFRVGCGRNLREIIRPFLQPFRRKHSVPAIEKPCEILHILSTAQPEGNFAYFVKLLAGGLDRQRYRLHAWFLGDSGPLRDMLEAAGVCVQVFSWERGVRDPLGAWRFWRALRRGRFEIIHLHTGGRLVHWMARRIAGTKMIRQFHGRVIEAQWNTMASLRSHGADAVIAVSQAVADRVMDAQPRVIYPGVAIPPNGAAAAAIHRPGPGPVLGTAGRFVPLKGFVYLIRAVPLLRRDFPDLHLELVGAGQDRAALEKEIQTLGLQSHVSLPGWKTDLGPHMNCWDLYVQPSLEEGFGLAVLEAMAHGLAVVATEVGGLRELVEDGRTGCLVAPADTEALAEQLRLLLHNPELRKAMGTAGLQRARAHFTADRMVREIGQVYDELLGLERVGSLRDTAPPRATAAAAGL